MFRKSSTPIRPDSVSDETDSASTENPLLSPLQVEQLADLIAQGRGDLPADLADLDRERVVAAVRQRFRNKMFLHICKALAVDMECQRPSRQEF